MQAYAEGFDILRNKDSKDLPEDERFTLNMPDIAEVWRRGSVISSWLLDLGAAALAKDPQLKEFSGYVQDSGEGRWTIEAAIEEAVPADVLSTRALCPLPLAAGAYVSAKRCSRPCASASAGTSRVRSRSIRNQSRRIAGSSRQRERRGVAPCPTDNPIRRSAPCRWRVAAAARSHAGRSLRHGDFRRQRRPDQAPGDAGALQSRAHQGAAGEICADRRRPGGGDRARAGATTFTTC